MANYTKGNLFDDVENQAPNYGMPDELEARFARTPVEGETLGLSVMRLDAGVRIPFGHRHHDRRPDLRRVRGRRGRIGGGDGAGMVE